MYFSYVSMSPMLEWCQRLPATPVHCGDNKPVAKGQKRRLGDTHGVLGWLVSSKGMPNALP
jgi:hypothetical protein